MAEKPVSSCFVNEEVIFAKFDVNGKEILISTNKGIRVFRIDGDKLREVNHPNLDKTGTVTLGSIYSGNVYNVIVGGDPAPKFAPNCFIIMEQGPNHINHCLTFKKDLVNVLNVSRVIIGVTIGFVWVINPRLKKGHVLYSYNTCSNPKGLISGGDPFGHEVCRVAFPAITEGQVAIIDTTAIFFRKPMSTEIIEAHEHPLACLAVSEDSQYLATASTEGTIIRVFKIATKEKVAVFRRGTIAAGIHCLRFSSNSEFLGCVSDNGSIHVFAVQNLNLNRRFVEAAEGLVPVTDMGSVGSFSVFRDFTYDIAFSKNGALNVIGSDGTFRQYLFLDMISGQTLFREKANTFDWILEFCNCFLFGRCYDPPEGQLHPRTGKLGPDLSMWKPPPPKGLLSSLLTTESIVKKP